MFGYGLDVWIRIRCLNIKKGKEMRIPEYLSPTSIGLFLTNREEFYMKYLANNKIPNIPQTQPMSVGSAFDAFVKSMLNDDLGVEISFKEVFEQQVEPQNREYALTAGKKCFEQYRKTGAYKCIFDLMKNAEYAKLEFRITKVIEGIPIQGIPDLYLIMKGGEHIVHDWKVNGWCAKSKTYPKKGYINLIDPSSKNNGFPHKEAIVMTSKSGILYNAYNSLEEADKDWARQLCVYAWIMGESVCSEFIASIDQLVCNDEMVGVAQHRYKVSCTFQQELLKQIQDIWSRIHNGNIFDENNEEKCDELEERCYNMFNSDSEFVKLVRT